MRRQKRRLGPRLTLTSLERRRSRAPASVCPPKTFLAARGPRLGANKNFLFFSLDQSGYSNGPKLSWPSMPEIIIRLCRHARLRTDLTIHNPDTEHNFLD